MPEVKLVDIASYYKGLPHQKEALQLLQQAMPDSLLKKDSAWHQKWTEVEREPAEVSNTWAGVRKAAQIAGAKFPEVVAAQWYLESAHGTHVSGKNNFFGIKGPGTTVRTWEDYGNGPVTVMDSFRDFASIQECIDWLVGRWYKDYRGYHGVNRANTKEECAMLLKSEGYATDPAYSHKLISLMSAHS